MKVLPLPILPLLLRKRRNRNAKPSAKHAMQRSNEKKGFSAQDTQSKDSQKCLDTRSFRPRLSRHLAAVGIGTKCAPNTPITHTKKKQWQVLMSVSSYTLASVLGSILSRIEVLPATSLLLHAHHTMSLFFFSFLRTASFDIMTELLSIATLWILELE